MKHYFIDFENVHSEGLFGIEALEAESKVYILYSESCKNLSLDIVDKASRRKIQILAYKANVGKNALDFQLSSLLGYVIGSSGKEKNEFFIVSKDTGFDAVVDFWAQQNVKLSRIASLGKNTASETGNKAQAQSQPKSKKKKASAAIPQTTKEELLKYLSKAEYSDDILMVVNSYKTRMAINNGFTHLFKDTGKAGAIYNKIKPLLKEKGKS